MLYIENEQEFRNFMVDSNSPPKDNSRGNYISWLRYLSSKGIKIDSNVPDGDKIVSLLKETENQRDRYKDASHYGDFKSAINKYREFIDSSYVSLFKDIEDIESNIQITDKETLIKARIGQGTFRKELIKLWQGCAVTGVSKTEFLRASHILPWRSSNNAEKLNPYNGLLLQPNFDTFFDKGYISFNDNGSIILSKKVEEQIFNKMGVFANNRLIKVYPENKPFLQRHREMFKETLNE